MEDDALPVETDDGVLEGNDRVGSFSELGPDNDPDDEGFDVDGIDPLVGELCIILDSETTDEPLDVG